MLQEILSRAGAAAAEHGGQLACWVQRVETGETAEVQSDRQIPSASTIKLAVMIELFRQARQGGVQLSDVLPVVNPWKAEGSGVLKELDAGLKLSLWDLITLMIIISDNVASDICLELAGLDRVNATILELGLTRTILRRKFLGRASLPAADNVTCAADMGRLAVLLARGQAVDADADMDMLTILRRQQDRSMAGYYAPDAILAHKTGWYESPIHVGDVGLLYRDGTTMAYAIFCSGTESSVVARLVIAALMRDLIAHLDEQRQVSLR